MRRLWPLLFVLACGQPVGSDDDDASASDDDDSASDDDDLALSDDDDGVRDYADLGIGCSCRTGPGATPGLLLLVVLLAIRRRRFEDPRR